MNISREADAGRAAVRNFAAPEEPDFEDVKGQEHAKRALEQEFKESEGKIGH